MKSNNFDDDAKLADLRQAIDDGDGSGIAEGDVFAGVREALHREAKRTIADASGDGSPS